MARVIGLPVGRLSLFLVLLAAGGCGWFSREEKVAPAGPADTLYKRLGGDGTIAEIVEDFVNRAANDTKVNFTRKGHPGEWNATPPHVATLKKHFTQFIEAATGGPQTYEGRPMAPVHAGMEITNDEFDAAAMDLKATLIKFRVPLREQEDLLKIVEGTRADIVGK